MSQSAGGPCAYSSCAGTNTVGITSGPRTLLRFARDDADGKIIAYEYHGWQHGFAGTLRGANGPTPLAEYAELLATGRKAAVNTGLRAQGTDAL